MTKGSFKDISYNLATAEDLQEFYGAPARESIRAIVFRQCGKLVAIGGMKSEKGRLVAFSELAPDATVSKVTIGRCAVVVMNMIKATKMPVWAIAERKGADTGKLVLWYGFEHWASNQDGEVYVLWPT